MKRVHHDYDALFEKLAPHAPTSQYQHNRTGEDNADAHMKRQIMGREVVVAITKANWSLVQGAVWSRRKRVLVKIIEIERSNEHCATASLETKLRRGDFRVALLLQI